MKSKLYFPAVDGLRGLAILSVLLYHTSWFSNGLLGVDVFMVLSGFLITLLLIREGVETGGISLKAFYIKRFKRLMPGLSVTLLATLVLTFILGGLTDARQVGQKAIAALLQVANWHQIGNSDVYWEGFGRINPLAHMWSLSITEQFYVVWPIVFIAIFFVFRGSVRIVTAAMAVALVGSALVAPLMFDGSNTDRLYLGTDVRAVDFIAGAVAAGVVFLLQRHRSDTRGAKVAASIAVAALVILVTTSILVSDYHEPWLYQGGIAAVAITTAVLIAGLALGRGPLNRALSFPPLIEIGRISYTMYLLHLPVYWVMHKTIPGIEPYALFIVGGLITWLASMLMHYLFSERVRVRPWRIARALPAALGLTVAISLGGAYLPAAVERDMNLAGRPAVLFLGDSLSADFAEALADYGKGNFAAVDGSISGCGVTGASEVRPRSQKVWPQSKECLLREQLWQETLDQASFDTIVLHFGWDAADQYLNGRWIGPRDPEYREPYLNRLVEVKAFLADAAPNTRLIVVNERTDSETAEPDALRRYNSIVATFARDNGVELFDLDRVSCAPGRCTLDGVHLSPEGKRAVATALEKRLETVE